MAGKFYNYAKEIDGASWADTYSITAGQDDLIVRGFQSVNGIQIHAYYIGSSEITLTNYNGFPTGTIIEDLQAHITREKTGATTWVASAART
jgi:hypothetical protein